MKKHIKKFILVLIVLISFSQFACGKAINLSFDKSSPSTLTISVDGKLKKIYFASSTDSEEIEDFNDLYSNGKITLDSSFFANYENGTYKLTVKAKSTKTYYIKVSGVAYAFNMVNKKDIFNIQEDKYYVLFSREGCGGCEQLKPDSITFNNFLSEYPDGTIPKMYVVDYSDPDMEVSKGEERSLLGLSNYEDLINNVSISTPTMMVIEKGVCTEYYINASNVSSFIYIEMKNIKDKIITHNVDSPAEIKIPLDFTPNRYSVLKPEDNKKSYIISSTYKLGETGFDGTDMVFSKYEFNRFMPGIYTLRIFNSETEQEKVLTLIIDSILNYITIDQIFEQKEENYYVFFLKDGCSGCASVEPTLYKYSQNYEKYDSEENYPIYAILRTMNMGFSYIGDPEVFVGATEWDQIKLGYYPRVVLIKNHEIVELYKNEGSQITKHFSEIMSKIK